jgi:hypothetical protein
MEARSLLLSFRDSFHVDVTTAVAGGVVADWWMLHPNMQGDVVGALRALPEIGASWAWFVEHGAAL